MCKASQTKRRTRTSVSAAWLRFIQRTVWADTRKYHFLWDETVCQLGCRRLIIFPDSRLQDGSFKTPAFALCWYRNPTNKNALNGQHRACYETKCCKIHHLILYLCFSFLSWTRFGFKLVAKIMYILKIWSFFSCCVSTLTLLLHCDGLDRNIHHVFRVITELQHAKMWTPHSLTH